MQRKNTIHESFIRFRDVPIALTVLGRGCIVSVLVLLVIVPADQFVVFAPKSLIQNQTMVTWTWRRRRAAVFDPSRRQWSVASVVSALAMLPERESLVIVLVHRG